MMYASRKQKLDKDPVEAYLRVRPAPPSKDASLYSLAQSRCLYVPSLTSVQLYNPTNCLQPPLDSPPPQSFTDVLPSTVTSCSFTRVFNESELNTSNSASAQQTVFEHVALPSLSEFVHGRDGVIFTYGVTSSGKTYTVSGSNTAPGILPRTLDVLFNSIGDLQAPKYSVRPDRERVNQFEVVSEAQALDERQRRDLPPSAALGAFGSQNRLNMLGGSTPSKLTRKARDPSPVTGQPGLLMTVPSDRVRESKKLALVAPVIGRPVRYAVFVSYIEIYNNFAYDLLEELQLDPIAGVKPPSSKPFREDERHHMFMVNGTEIEVKSADEALELFYKGQQRRKVAHTALNAESSRSHSIFNLRLVQAPFDEASQTLILDNKEQIYVSQLSIVDLAGSERTARTNAVGQQLKEAGPKASYSYNLNTLFSLGNINESLMVLRNCLDVLRRNQRNNVQELVPYRTSKITHYFKNFFEGGGRVKILVCINPAAEEYDENVHVLKFAESAQEVQVPRSAPQPQPLAPVRKRPLPDPPSSSKRLNPGPTASVAGDSPSADVDMVIEEARFSEILLPELDLEPWPDVELRSMADAEKLPEYVEYIRRREKQRADYEMLIEAARMPVQASV